MARLPLVLTGATMTMLIAGVAASAHTSCRAEGGAAKARTLVRHCLQVSAATHPPCNAANPCALIISEIRRGCGLIGKGGPKFCRQYRD